MKSGKNPRPLWRCPKCGKYYVTRNMWHACARHTLTEHFSGRNPLLRQLFDGYAGLLKRCGPLKIVPGKTGIALQQRMRFAGVIVRRNHLEAGFTLRRRLEHPRIKKVIAFSPRAYAHFLDLRSPADLDAELAEWLRESYRVGQQADLAAGEKRAAPAVGDLSWSELSTSRPIRASAGGTAAPRGGGKKPAGRSAPLWRCPRCGRTFPTRNQMHVCARLALDDALQGKSREAIGLFRRLTAAVRRFGPVTIVPQKTRIAFQADGIFLGVRLLREAVDCELKLPRRIEHPRFRQILSPSRGTHYHYLRITSAAELDRQVLAWLREAYRAAASALTRRS